jgi:protein involved in polysaccharide export with SLBB domain
LFACGCGVLTKSPAHFTDVPIPAEVSVPDSRHFDVTGEVRHPGRQGYLGRIKLSQAIETAGGATKSADLKRVRVQRAGGTIEYHNLLNEPHSDPEVFPLDTVEVRKKKFLW